MNCPINRYVEKLGFTKADSVLVSSIFYYNYKREVDGHSIYIKYLDDLKLTKCWIEYNEDTNYCRIFRELFNYCNPRQVFMGRIKKKRDLKKVLQLTECIK